MVVEFKNARRLIRVNRILQIILAFTLLVGINFLAHLFFWTKDLSENRRFTLAAETQAYLDDLEGEFEIWIPYDPTAQGDLLERFYLDLEPMIGSFQNALDRRGRGILRYRKVDLFKDRAVSLELLRRYGNPAANSVIVRQGGDSRILGPDEFYQMGEGQQLAFVGESVLLSSFLEVSTGQGPVIAFTSGHGERVPGESHPVYGLSELALELSRRNYQLRTVNLSADPQALEEVDLLMVVGPRSSFLGEEVEVISEYLQRRGGRALFFLEAAVSSGLEPMLAEWGLLVPDMVLVDPGPDFRSSSGDFILRGLSAKHPATRSLMEAGLPLISGVSRPVMPLPDVASREGVELKIMVTGGEQGWGESDYMEERGPIQFDLEEDLPGPLPVGISAERKVASELGVVIPAGRLAAFGGADLLGNQRIRSLGNLSFVLNLVRWSLERDQFLNVPTRRVNQQELQMSAEQLKKLRIWVLAGVPGLVLLTGILIGLARRN